MLPANNNWLEANQRYLIARLGALRDQLERQVSRVGGQPAKEIAEHDAIQSAAEEATRTMQVPPAIVHVCSSFGLSAFESDLLLLCAGVELDPTFAALCSAAQGDTQRRYATFSLALAALSQPHWSALSPIGPLRRWSLLELGSSNSLVAAPLRIDERILHYLTGVDHLDDRLAGVIEPMETPRELVPSHQRLSAQIVEVWRRQNSGTKLPVVLLCGEDDWGKLSVASAAAHTLGLRAGLLHSGNLPMNPKELDGLLRLCERESTLSGVALCLEVNDTESMDTARERALTRFTESLDAPLLLACHERRVPSQRGALLLRVFRPKACEQQRIWEEALGPAALALNGEVRALVSQFSINVSGVRSAVAEAFAAEIRESGQQSADEEGNEAAVPAGSEPSPAMSKDTRSARLGRRLWDACRQHTRPRLADHAQRIEALSTWEDLVLPDQQVQILHQIVVHVRHRALVYESWGFASKGSRGLGISALFAGTSGTGKTMAAEVLANDLRLDLYRIDLSSVVSKYIGETEKNLRRVFDAAEEGGAILLFDEADALFGKRSDVKDSHDRYANIEISYLLQRMEAYRGLAILTTNMKSALDTAFLRRIRFVVHFPFPDAAQRAEIWRRIFPCATPTAGLDYNRLSHLNVTGGNIRNIALNGAFLAADAGEPVGMKHLLNAARSEYGKLEKALTEAEVGGWMN
jgi:ATPase family associated with various cellular activities (AAA)